LQRLPDAVTMLDSMELTTPADLQTREWIIASLAMKHAKNDATLAKRGNEAAERLLNFRLSERDLLNLVPILHHFSRPKDAQRIYDNLAATVSDRRLLAELFNKLVAAGESQNENAAKAAQRILRDPTFLQNSRRLAADVRLMEDTIKVLQKQNKMNTVMPMLENRLRGLRDITDARLLSAKLYMLLDRKDEAKTLALELAANPTAEPERRQIITRLLLDFGLQKELEAMNRLLIDRKNSS
jgi:hypothetical protein